MSDDKKIPIGEEQWIIPPDEPEAPAEQIEPPAPQKPAGPAAPASTGDMQKVGATEPAEVPRRREEVDGEEVDGEPPVEEDPGDQNSG